jgi:hypothetical protein
MPNFIFQVFREPVERNKPRSAVTVAVISGDTPEDAERSVRDDMVGPNDRLELLDEVDTNRHDALFYDLKENPSE